MKEAGTLRTHMGTVTVQQPAIGMPNMSGGSSVS